VDFDGTSHTVVGQYNAMLSTGKGSILVDGRMVDIWGTSLFGQPRERHIDIGGKPVTLVKTGLFRENFDLYVDGVLVQPEK